jgi:hypothetical protein
MGKFCIWIVAFPIAASLPQAIVTSLGEFPPKPTAQRSGVPVPAEPSAEHSVAGDPELTVHLRSISYRYL